MAREPGSSKYALEEVGQDSSAMVKSAFRIWISKGRSKQHDPNSVIDLLDDASEQLLHRRLLDISLWKITNPRVFSTIYEKTLNDKLFRVTDRKTYSAFIQLGKLYLEFLKSKPVFKATNVVPETTEKLSSSLTIKEAIIGVLETAQRGLTVEEIYNKIIENHLYTFGAQYPKDVVRNVIEYACEDSNYTAQALVPSFRFERNPCGRKVYFLRPINTTLTYAGETVSGVVDPMESNNNSLSPSTLYDVIDLEEGQSGIREILATHFQTLYGYSNINILWNAAQSSLSMFLNDNAINTPDALWTFLGRFFVGEFVLSSPHIWQSRPDYPQSRVGLVVNLAQQYGGIVTREQIDDYFSRIKLNVPGNAAILRQGLLLFCANKSFVLAETINLTDDRCDTIRKALNRLFSIENLPYIILRDISEEWFAALPEIKGGIPWTALLLQEVLRVCPNIGYRVISSGLGGQSLDTLGVAVVSSTSEIVTFADVVHRFCYEKYMLPRTMAAEELRLVLREAGMLEGNELIYNIHKALKDYRFGFTDENKKVKILER